MKELDARGLACPEPVLMVMNELKKEEFPFRVLVSEPHQKDNVVKLVTNRGLKARAQASGSEFEIYIEK